MLDTMATEIVRRRRDYSAGLKEQILLECAQPGASVAKIAMTHGINANIVHGWRKLAREANALMLPAPSFVQVTVAAEDRAAAPARQIDLEVRRGSFDSQPELADDRGGRSGYLATRAPALIRIEAIWLSVEPLDMRAGTDTALARVVHVFGAARPHHAYLFANKRVGADSNLTRRAD